MNKKYCYVVVATDGESAWAKLLGWSFEHEEEYGFGGEEYLSELLRDGWHPVRETPMGGHTEDGCVYSLLLLEKYED